MEMGEFSLAHKQKVIEYFIELIAHSFDDIIIGAPLYSSPVEKDSSYEKGRVYVALQTRDVSINRFAQFLYLQITFVFVCFHSISLR